MSNNVNINGATNRTTRLPVPELKRNTLVPASVCAWKLTPATVTPHTVPANVPA